MGEFEKKLCELEDTIREAVARRFRNEYPVDCEKRVKVLRAEILAMRKIAP